MLPPWKKHPRINRFSIGWRMGSGEEYLWKWRNYFIKLSSQEQDEYIKKHPQPITWFWFYKIEKRDDLK